MKHKIIIALLFVLTVVKGFSQDTLKMNPFIINDFAIVEISKTGNLSAETTIIYFDDGKMADVADKIYNGSNDLPLAQKVLKCMKYMKEKNYDLVSSTSTAAINAYHYYSTYDYQYIFKRKEK